MVRRAHCGGRFFRLWLPGLVVALLLSRAGAQEDPLNKVHVQPPAERHAGYGNAERR